MLIIYVYLSLEFIIRMGGGRGREEVNPAIASYGIDLILTDWIGQVDDGQDVEQ